MKLEVQRQGNNKWRAWNAITLYITTFDFCYTFFLDFDLNKIKFYCSLIQSSCLNQFSAPSGIFERWVNMKIQWSRNLCEFEIGDWKVIFIYHMNVFSSVKKEWSRLIHNCKGIVHYHISQMVFHGILPLNFTLCSEHLNYIHNWD